METTAFGVNSEHPGLAGPAGGVTLERILDGCNARIGRSTSLRVSKSVFADTGAPLPGGDLELSVLVIASMASDSVSHG
jgi:hypothetical protein